jgi:hypothetical protein
MTSPLCGVGKGFPFTMTIRELILIFREPKDVTEEEYKNFYKATFKQYSDPLLWHHFKGDSGPVSFKALIFVPSSLCVAPLLECIDELTLLFQ